MMKREVGRFLREKVYPVLFRNKIDSLLRIFGGHILFETLYAAVEFDLFTLLSERRGLTAEEIAQELGIHEKPARILLLGLSAAGLLNKRDEKYVNAKLSELALSRHASENIIAYVKCQHHVYYKGMFHFYEALKTNRNVGLEEFDGTGSTLYERLSHTPDIERVFQDAMQELSIWANRDLMRHLQKDLSKIKFIVDVGGGDATNLIAVAEKFPNIQGAVFDLPTVCSLARENIKTSPFSDRLSAIPGDCFKDPFPDHADCFIFSHFFTMWSAQKDRLLLDKCYEALPKGGKVIIFNMMQRNDGIGPLTAAIGSPYFLTIATGEGMLYTWNEYITWMKEAGFKKIKVKKLPHDHGAIIGTKC